MMREGDQEWCEVFYHRWVEAVRQGMPTSQVLEYNMKQGWAPLCEWSKGPEPDTPCHSNECFQDVPQDDLAEVLT